MRVNLVLKHTGTSAEWNTVGEMKEQTGHTQQHEWLPEHAESEGLTQGLHAVALHLQKSHKRQNQGDRRGWWFVGRWGRGEGGEGLTTGNFVSIVARAARLCINQNTLNCKLIMGEFYCVQIIPPKLGFHKPFLN